MRKEFAWYLQPTEAEYRAIWEKGTLTLDTNVLLDLYRYHDDTRQVLIRAIEKFKGRTWLSNQAAEEFFRNRRKVIATASNFFNDAEKELQEISKSIAEPLKNLRSVRFIPESIGQSLDEGLSRAIAEAHEQIDGARKKHPSHLDEDPILEKLLQLFDGAIGKGYDNKQYETLIEEAKRRANAKIPPGYLDAKKDGLRPYGDFIMWRQILDYTKSRKIPLIFVTSEQKEDWWEVASGKTTGPQYELLKEAALETGQRILFYRTDRFVEFATKDSDGKKNVEAVKEIREIVTARTPRERIVQSVLQSTGDTMPDYQSGTVRVTTARATPLFTFHIRLSPPMDSRSSVKIQLLDHPTALEDFRLTTNLVCPTQASVHLLCRRPRDPLPEGTYVFEYEVEMPTPDVSEGEDLI